MISNLKRSILFLSTGLLLSCAGGSSLKTNQGAKVGDVNGNPIYFGEVWDEYQRSNAAIQDSLTLDNFNHFTSLYFDFKTKIAASHDAGYFADSTINTELSNYETQYAVPFWLEKEIEKQMLDELIEREKTDLEISHILINLQPNQPPEDTLKAYNKLMEARAKVEKGADFDSLSIKISSFRDGRSMGGPLGWMSSGRAVKPFEDVAYNTPVGQMSMPFMTQFGMHILKVTNKRPHPIERKASHVYWRSGGEKAKQDSIIALANSLRADIISGKTTWDSVVVKYTEDGISKRSKGDIGWVSSGRYYPIFNDSVFSLKNEGDISYGFYSGYGVHLLRFDSLKTYKTPEAKRSEALTKLKNLPRYKNNKEATNLKLRQIAKPKKNSANAERFRLFISSDSVQSQNLAEVKLPKALADMDLFVMRGKIFTGNDYLTWLVGKFAEQTGSNYSYHWFDDFIESCTETFLIPMTKERFPEFKKTADEYLRGLVVFKITEDSVWNFVKTDTTNLLQLYNQEPGKYRFDKRYSFWRISSSNDSLLTVVRNEIKKGTEIDSIKKMHKNVFMVEDILSDISEEPFYRLGKIKDGDVTEIFEFKKRSTILYLKEVLEPRDMNFDEAFYRVVADYQPIREKNWMESLRKRYKTTINTQQVERSFNAKKTKL